MGHSIQQALLYHETNLSPRLIKGLLSGDGEGWGESGDVVTAQLAFDGYSDDNYGKKAGHLLMSGKDKEETATISEELHIFKGIPRQPFYCEVASRIVLLGRWHHQYNQSNHDGQASSSPKKQESSTAGQILYRPLLDSKILGLTESPPPKLYLPPSDQDISPSSCSNWLQSIGNDGVLELLGMRQTTGTESLCLPPTISTLRKAAQASYRPDAKPPQLTVAARARAKHAHRGKKDLFFGESKGNTVAKNKAADIIICNMLRDAVWINCHTFGGISSPILEVRVSSGYGARWSCDWNEESAIPTCVTFRGFLEPQMENGFEKKWIH